VLRLETLASQQLRVRDQEVQLQPPLILVLNPQHAVLVFVESGELKTRQDVTEALESAGFEVVRTTKSSISIADPDGGRNIRL
ncbi:hypothetical protein, partial [Enterobacter hormaechei]|uniref:hypothetical protein n=1 Tax=Enterobacter hormaechei TaxID=158836 RepID=UPI0025A1C04D